MANVTDKTLVAIGQRVVVGTAEGELKATISGFPFKTKNFVSVIYDMDEKKKPVSIDLDMYGEFVKTTRGRRPNDAYEIPGATLSADHLAAVAGKTEKAKPATKAAPVTVAPTRSRKAAEVATPAPVAATRSRKAATPAVAAAPVKKAAGSGIANSGSGMLMKIAGSKAYALAKEPSEAGLADLLATVESGFRSTLGIGAKPARKAREVAAAPAPVAAPVKTAPVRRAAPAPVAAPVAAKPVQRVKAGSVPQMPTMKAPTIGRRPVPMS